MIVPRPTKSVRFASVRFASVLIGALAVVTLAAGCGSSKNTSTSPTSAAKGAQGTNTTKGSGCPQGTWPKNYLGEPKTLKQADQTGVYVWSDFSGLHFRVRDVGDRPAKVQGSVTGSNNLTSVKPSPDGTQTVTLQGNKVSFDLQAGKDLKGFDLNVPCAVVELQWSIATPAGPWPADLIFTGANSKGTGSNFTMTRS